ncbi:MAG: glycine cleavage system protein H [Spirochaetes bacterium GWD1_61_31]|nr:MAG: glycine cleavage system protein H [Spirochaetes bacterium GWB1_60_80]OHD32943.1 MAG: glycine cleavage system protein H [Spirochaetes bacterium GWC1_61_12]OHD43219.1 MAG: glycine cleavage system protein H [Spirochaetes bacterium GWE1_60_18]OHD44190.1 MAG: glycine cleavage system protein H [Spirochaetes bacterium GWD1_61_31]OHD58780.1 MAG: glycine cleavage system protein H [Spirochaetes bacterium GWF1_60_12]HAP42699.1 glycine cleavage system protein GcvH [Spirochaetaceae bacterium]
MNIDKNARYAASHEYALKAGDVFVVGISDHAQSALGDIVFVELPAVGKTFKQGEAFGVIESVKAASDVYLPMAGTITEVNGNLEADPALVNREPHGGGWLIKFKAANPADFNALLDAAAYETEAAKE